MQTMLKEQAPGRERERLLKELDQVTAELLEARRELVVLREELHLLKRSLGVRFARLFDRVPAAKDMLIRIGNVIFPE